MNFYFSKARNKGIVLFVLALLSGVGVNAQQTDRSVYKTERNKVDNTPTFITFAAGANVSDQESTELFKKYLGIDGVNVTMVPVYSTTTKSQVTAKRFNEYYKGVKVAYGSYTLTCKNGVVSFMTGNYYPVDNAMTTTPAISESDAFAKALTFVGADKYMWQDPLEEQRIKKLYNKPDTTFKPRGVLTLIEDFRSGNNDRKLHLAYLFNIYAQEPLSRQEVYIDAATGKVLLSNSLIKHTAASGHTRYSGVVPFQTSDLGATFELFDSTRGSGVHTLNMNNGSSYGASTEYTSVTNTWPLLPADSIALDAHWGGEMVYDYWKIVQGRLSYDNADGILLQYVHYQSGYNNAFWDGTEMTYGDGTGCGSGFTPLTSLDVTGHEIGHGVCEYTANLVYSQESGAMNESFSDCWGATIEFWADPHETDLVPKSTWMIGEEIKCGNPLRRMDFPKLKGDPDTYGGTNWVNQVGCIPSSGNDECGVHTNSGVMNKWYYLVVAGGSGTNDLSNAYSVTGIGFTEGANILYQTELALSSTADYALMRTTSIATAVALYGPCSPEEVTVTNAWYAVGVGAAYVAYPANIAGSNNICVGATTALTDATPGGTWISSFPAIATVSSGGLVTGVTAGVDTIIYTIGAGCDAKMLLTVDAFPVATISPAPTATLCIGSSVILTATAGAGYTYQWHLGAGTIPGATNMTYSATATGNYTVDVISPAGCSTTSSATTVNGVAPPPATITAASSTTFCIGGSVVLNANTGAGLSYQWVLDGIPIVGATTASYTASVGGNYTVIVFNISGCNTTSAVTAVVVNPLPATITGIGLLCVSLTTTLSDASGGGTWSSGSTGIATVAPTTGVVTGVAAGTADITYTLGTGCLISSTVTVNAFPTPIAGSANLCPGTTTTLSDGVPGGTWSSSSPAIAPVDVTGTVTGVSTGSANITYTMGAGCFVTLPVTVNPLPPAITGTATVCTGATTTLSNGSAGGTWSSGATGIATVAPGTGVVSGVSAGIAAITYTLPTGCLISRPVTVNTVTAAPIGGVPAVCLGQTITLTDATPGGVWSSGAPSVATISSTGVVSGVSVGMAIISYTVTNGCGTAYAITTLTVNALPVVAAITGTTTICSGTTTTLSDATSGGIWSSGTPSVATINSFGLVSAIVPGTSNILYTYTNVYGCSSSSAVVFNVFSPFTATIAASGPTTFCSGASVLLTASSGSGVSYQWKKNGVDITGATSPGYVATTTGNYTILETAPSGCNSLSAPVTVTVNTGSIVVPTVSVAATPGTTFCLATTPASFLATGTNEGLTPSYQWYVNGTVVGAGNFYSYTPTAGDTVKCVMTSSEACAFPATVSHTDVITVSPMQTPSVSITGSTPIVCQGDLATFTAAPVFGGTSPSYNWTLNGISVWGGASYSYVPANGDVLVCTMTSNYPCLLTTTAASAAYTVHVQSTIPNSINIYASNVSIAPGVPDTFVAVAPYGGTAPVYQWRINGAPVPGATNSMFITSALIDSMVVSCEVTSSNPCVYPRTELSSGLVVRVWGTGVHEVTGNGSEYMLLPNPNKGSFTISGKLKAGGNQQVSITVTDILGQAVYRENVSVDNGALQHHITLDKSLADGVYLVYVVSGADKVVFHMALNK